MNSKEINEMNCFYISFQKFNQSLHEILKKFKESPEFKFNKSPSIVLEKINILLQISYIL